MGVVDDLVGFTVGERARIDGFQFTEQCSHGPADVVEAVIDRIRDVVLDFEIAEIRVGEEDAVRDELLEGRRRGT